MSTPSSDPSLPQPESGRLRKHSALLLVLAVVITLGRLCASDFTFWDDPETVFKNFRLNPPTLDTLRYYWTTPVFGLFVPLTYTVWALVAKVAYIGSPDEFGIMLNPWPFHTANLLVHLTSSVLALWLLRRLTRAEVPALLGALLFAVHPVQVETVGWVSGLKDLLCWCLGIASLLAYVRRVQIVSESPHPRSLWKGWELPVSALLLSLALLSKPTAMVVPAAMLACDGLLLRRRWLRPMIELAPLFVLAAVAAVLARNAQYVDHIPTAAIWQRPFVVGDALAFYLGKIAWPGTLTIDYGRTPSAVMASPLAFFAWVVPAALVAAAILVRRRAPLVTAAVAIFLTGIAPVSGVASFQMQRYSTVTDHYLYFAMLGPALALAWVLTRWRGRQLRIAACAAIVLLAARSFVQAGVWENSFTLFGHASAANPRSFLAPSNLAATYLAGTPSRPDLAEPHVDRAYANDPRDFAVLETYASTKAELGKRDEAMRAWSDAYAAVLASPRGVGMRAKYAAEVAGGLLRLNEPERAMEWATRALESQPGHPAAVAVLAAAQKMIAARPATQPTTLPATAPATAASPAPRPASTPAAAGGRG